MRRTNSEMIVPLSEVIDFGPLSDCELEVCSNGTLCINEIRDAGQVIEWIKDIPTKDFLQQMLRIRKEFSDAKIDSWGLVDIKFSDNKGILPAICICDKLDGTICLFVAKDDESPKELARASYAVGFTIKLINVIAKVRESHKRLTGEDI